MNMTNIDKDNNLPYFSEDLSMSVKKTQDKSLINLEEKIMFIKMGALSPSWHCCKAIAWIRMTPEMTRDPR